MRSSGAAFHSTRDSQPIPSWRQRVGLLMDMSPWLEIEFRIQRVGFTLTSESESSATSSALHRVIG